MLVSYLSYFIYYLKFFIFIFMLDLIKIQLIHFLKKEFIDYFIIYLKKIINQAFDVYLNNLSKINFKVNPSSFNFYRS